MTEAEAQAIRFTIDHYEPRQARPDLEDDYANLMYACDECNLRKGDRSPPPAARDDGWRFFRPDEDRYEDNFELKGLRVSGKTHTGEFTIDAVDLNRLALRRLRELRQRLLACDRFIVEGMAALRGIRIDELPPHVKAQALTAIQGLTKFAETLADNIDDILRDSARSPLIEEESESPERMQERAARLGRLGNLYPGTWRAPRRARKSRG